MAKRKIIPGLAEMEDYMQYSIKSNEWIGDTRTRYYSDLEPVSEDIYSRTLREYEAEKAQRGLGTLRPVNPQCSVPQLLRRDESNIKITRLPWLGHFVFDVHVAYDFGLEFSLLLTNSEVERVIDVIEPKSEQLEGSPIFTLPKEIRDRIYEFSIPRGTWRESGNDTTLSNFADTLRISSGFYFPFRDITLLSSCRQVRCEALALAFRHTTFCFDDIDATIQFLIAAGSGGRLNVRALEFSWSSRTDQQSQWKYAPTMEDFYPTLPSLHVEECTLLLRQCKNLDSLCLKFDGESLAGLEPQALKGNNGLDQLCKLHKLRELSVVNLDGEMLEQNWFTQWLREQLVNS